MATIQFKADKNTGYKPRTLENAKADVTFAIAVDFYSAGEICTLSAVKTNKKHYLKIDISDDLSIKEEHIDTVVDFFNQQSIRSVNIAGNGIYTFKDKYTQQELDYYVFGLLYKILSHKDLKHQLESIRTGGQTGIDESGAKAGYLLQIPTTILAPKGWKFRGVNGKDISDEALFKDRFTKTLEWDGSNWEEFLEKVEKFIL